MAQTTKVSKQNSLLRAHISPEILGWYVFDLTSFHIIWKHKIITDIICR